VFMGFLIGSLIAVPLGVFCGLSPTVNAALNPLIQIFKPVSPLAWLPLVTMVVSALYVSDDPMFEKFGQVYMTSAYPGVVKAWHFHKKQTDHFCVVKGMMKVVLYDSRDMATIYRVVAFMGLGVTMLLGAFAYIYSNKKFEKDKS